MESLWTCDLGGKLSAMVMAGGKLFVAQVDQHTVHALDAASGKQCWSFTAGGRVDSPPTIYSGNVLFGSTDGWVYCLRASDGTVVWRFRGGARQRRLVSYGQLESAWPVHGSILVVDGAAYCIAGRSMFLDGGMRFLKLDAVTGEKLAETILDEVDPTTRQELQLKLRRNNMPPALADILSSDGHNIYMKSQAFDFEGRRRNVAVRDLKDQYGQGAHLFSPGGFLDGSGFHRNYWLFGKANTCGAAASHEVLNHTPGGRILVFEESTVFGFSRMPHLNRWVRTLELHMFAADRLEPNRKPVGKASLSEVRQALFRVMRDDKSSEKDRQEARCKFNEASLNSTVVKYKWSNYDPPMYVTAMALADRMLLVAGPPAMRNEETIEALDRWQGKKGGILQVISADSGKVLNTLPLEYMPVWDGVIVADATVFVSLKSGTVVAFGKR